MDQISIPMAIVDFVPVLLFFSAAVILQRDLYNKMEKGPFALLSAGSILVLLGGIYKAVWKILYALSICDFSKLNASFFPLQGPGFLFVFLAMASLLFRSKKDNTTPMFAAVPAIYDSNLIFIICQTVGCGGLHLSLFAIARRMKKTGIGFLFLLAFFFMLGMGYLGAKFDDTSSMHWIAQGTNILSQGFFLAGVILLHKEGLGKEDALKKRGA